MLSEIFKVSIDQLVKGDAFREEKVDDFVKAEKELNRLLRQVLFKL